MSNAADSVEKALKERVKNCEITMKEYKRLLHLHNNPAAAAEAAAEAAADEQSNTTAEVIKEKKKDVLLSAMALQHKEDTQAPDDDVNKLKARIANMQSEIADEAVRRCAAIADKDELDTLGAVLQLLAAARAEGGDKQLDMAQQLLVERQTKVLQRTAPPVDEQEEERLLKEDTSQLPAVPETAPEPPAITPEEWSTPEYWTGIAPGATVGEGCEPSSAVNLEDAKEQVETTGFFLRGEGSVSDVETVRQAMRAVTNEGWPVPFVWLFDQPWQVVLSIWDEAERILGCPVVLEPTVAAYQLERPEIVSGKYVGRNFGVPHRDYTFSQTFRADGSPTALTVWVPVTEATVDNGCMYVVPKQFDALFDSDQSFMHQQVIKSGSFGGHQCVHFPIDGCRPLPSAPGGVMGWLGNVIHWGSSNHVVSTADPRASIAWVFRAADTAQAASGYTREDITAFTLSQRLEVCCNSVKTFKQWYKVPSVLKKRIKALYNLHKWGESSTQVFRQYDDATKK